MQVMYHREYKFIFQIHCVKYNRQNSPADDSMSPTLSTVKRCPVVAAFYENTATRSSSSADKYIRLCSIVTSRAADGQRKRLVYTSTSNQLYIHVVNVTERHTDNDHVLLRYDGPFNCTYCQYTGHDYKHYCNKVDVPDINDPKSFTYIHTYRYKNL